ncbi:MAG TPA: glycosyltransferase family 2 protein [Patescibacteria group bacterium]|nr:glycosyltransferase family 2 protein [Patescibacteria group bacterium]
MISAVIPVFNEQESLPEFYKRLSNSLSKIDKSHEIIFVDDGSTDGSLDIMKKFAAKDKHVKILSFRKNQGKSEGLTLGFQMAKGDIIVTLDADLQDVPEEIERLYKKAKEGYELVCGWRKNRRDPVQKVISSKFFNFIAKAFWGLDLHDYNCGLKLYSQEAAKSLRMYGGMHRFIPLLVYGQGFLVTEVPIEHRERMYGKSKYGFSKLWKDLPDILTMLFLTKYGKRPLHFFGTIGGLLFAIGLVVLSYLSWYHFTGHSIGTRPLLFLGIVLLLAGLQVLFTGFLADLLINLSQTPKSVEERFHFHLKYDSTKKGAENISL